MRLRMLYKYSTDDVKAIVTKLLPELEAINKGEFAENPFLDSPFVEFYDKQDALEKINNFSTIGQAYIGMNSYRIAIFPNASDGTVLFSVSVGKGQTMDLNLAQSLKSKFESALHQAGYPIQLLESTLPETATAAA